MRLVLLRSNRSGKQDVNLDSDAHSLASTKSGPLGPTLTDLAYTAGYLDGEGCFLWNRTPTVEVKNTYPKILQWLKSKYGGSVRLSKSSHNNSRSQYIWRVCGSEALSLCQILVPYLREKKDQASILCQIVQFKPNTEARRRRIESLRELKKIEYAANRVLHNEGTLGRTA